MKKYTEITEFLDDLDKDTVEQVAVLRNIILANVPVTEHIKWNSPSYVYHDEDRITFSIRGSIKVILHMGATRPEDKSAAPILEDKTGLVKWNSNIRGTVEFKSMDDIESKQSDFINVLKKWIAIE